MCLAVAGRASDAVVTRPCAATGNADPNAAWVAVGDGVGGGGGTAPAPQLASVVDGGMCLNVYGGVKDGCKAGAAVHLATCGANREGNLMRFDPARSQIVVVAAQCESFCVDAGAGGAVPSMYGGVPSMHGGGAVALAPCSLATTWGRKPAAVVPPLADAPPPLPRVGPMPFGNITRLTMMAVTIVPPLESGAYSLALNMTNVTQSNFAAITACVSGIKGAGGKPIEQLITLGLDIPVWTKIVADGQVAAFGEVAVAFLQAHNLDGMNFDWEDNVDTKVYMGLLSGLRKAFDSATPKKRYLITVAPGWPQYPWDASANGVVDAFDMMSYANSLDDLTSRVTLFTETYGIPKSALLGAVECEPHWQPGTTPGGENSDTDIVQKARYAVQTQLQGMMSFRIDNDHGPWPVHPARPTYDGVNLLWQTAAEATAAKGGLGPTGFVLNTYISLHDPFSNGQICGQ